MGIAIAAIKEAVRFLPVIPAILKDGGYAVYCSVRELLQIFRIIGTLIVSGHPGTAWGIAIAAIKELPFTWFYRSQCWVGYWHRRLAN